MQFHQLIGVVVRLLCVLTAPQLSPVGGVKGRNLLGRNRAARLGCAPDAAVAVLKETHALEVCTAPAEPRFDQAATTFLRGNCLLLLSEPLGADHLLDDLFDGSAVADLPHGEQRGPQHLGVWRDVRGFAHSAQPTDVGTALGTTLATGSPPF